ncbi:hypothetical protein KGP36_07165 [Patescibacteria group bacterium]|nr:hypothetical protein [Patescibacteria group bacterium]
MTQETTAVEAAQIDTTVNTATTPEAAPQKDGVTATPGAGDAPTPAQEKKEDSEASEAARLLAQRKQTARERVQQAVARQREAERQSAEKDKIISDLTAKLKKPDPAQYEDSAQYTADVLDHRLAERDIQSLAREKSGAEAARQSAIAEAWQERVRTYKSDNPADDFDAVAFYAPISDAVGSIISEMEEGPAVAYVLGKNHAEARRINALPGHLKAIELGKIAERLASPSPKKLTQAPVPIKTVGSGGTGGSPEANDDDLTTEQWLARRRAQLRAS